MTTPEQGSAASAVVSDLFNFNPGSRAIAFAAGRADHKAKDASDGEESSSEGSEEN
jgi:hypothetical protein